MNKTASGERNFETHLSEIWIIFNSPNPIVLIWQLKKYWFKGGNSVVSKPSLGFMLEDECLFVFPSYVSCIIASLERRVLLLL